MAAITAGVVTFCVIGLGSLVYGFADTVPGIILSAVVALASAGAIGALVYFVIWIAIGFLGMTAGVIIAILTYTSVFSRFAWADFWSPIALILIGLITSMILSFNYQMQMVLIGTSLFGGSLVTRGVIYLFNSSEPLAFIGKLIAWIWLGKPVDWSDNWVFAIYLAAFIAITIFFIVWQCKTQPSSFKRDNLQVSYTAIN